VRLHVEADAPAVTLEEVTAGGRWMRARPICRAPCDQFVDAHGQSGLFVLAGEGIVPSSPFHLTGHGRDVALDVAVARSARRAGGFAMAFIGAAGVVAGLSMIALGAIPTTSDGGQSPGLVAAGGVAGGVGLGLLVGGIVLVVKTRTTFAFRPAAITF
jgi:hypothetical protein